MLNKIKAAVAVGEKETEIQELNKPYIEINAGLLKVEIVGVCGTDVSYYNKYDDSKILGHHVIGSIEEIGEVASEKWGVKAGDRVAMEEYIPCGQCSHCRTGAYRACLKTDPKVGGLRYGAIPISESPALYGGFSQYMYLHPNAVVHQMPDHTLSVEAALTLPLANGFEWMSLQGGVGPGDTVVIQGPGQQGLACALAAKTAGADNVIMTGRSSSSNRLEISKKLGVDHIINIQTEDLLERVTEITNGKMADVVIDVTSGGSLPVITSVEMANKDGTVIYGAYKDQKIPEFPLDDIIHKTLNIKGVRGHSYQSVQMAIDCIASGKFPLEIMNSHDYSLQDVDLALRTAGGEGDPSRLLVTVSPWK